MDFAEKIIFFVVISSLIVGMCILINIKIRTTYMIEIPNGSSCEGNYSFLGKGNPIKVNCIDGSFYITPEIKIKYKLIDNKRVY